MKNSTELSNDKLQEGVSPSLATIYAGVAELADAPVLGTGVPDVQVQVLSPAP